MVNGHVLVTDESKIVYSTALKVSCLAVVPTRHSQSFNRRWHALPLRTAE